MPRHKSWLFSTGLKLLILGIVMGTAYIFTAKSGVKLMLVSQPFFYCQIHIEVDLKECPRAKLRQQCIKYFGPQEREYYEFVVVDGKILTGKPLNTFRGSPGAKWIFVMSTSKRLYAGEKKKGLFHHSSFLAGGATLAAGRLVSEDGVLKGMGYLLESFLYIQLLVPSVLLLASDSTESSWGNLS